MPLRSFLLLTFSLLASLPVNAAQFETFGVYQVHYSAFTGDTLSPAVAEQYDIKRSAGNGVLNISVLKTEDGERTAHTAEMQATATNLLGQKHELVFKKIQEQDALYYIAQWPVTHAENVLIQVQGKAEEGQVFKFSFRQKFYGNP